MHLPSLELHEATTLAEAADLLTRHAPRARVLAGGTDLLVDLKTGRVDVEHLVAIGGVPELRGVSRTDAGLQIGALTTISELDRSRHVADGFEALRDATSRMAAPQIRNVATVGGNLAGAVPCADLPPVLLVLDATVRLWSPAGERELGLDAFFKGPRETALGPGELVTAVLVPDPPEGGGAAYERLSLRDGNAIAVAGVAASLVLDGAAFVRETRIALAAVAPTPRLVDAAAAALVGRPLDEDATAAAAEAARAAAEPISDIRGSAGYRREVVGVLTRRALAAAARRARR